MRPLVRTGSRAADAPAGFLRARREARLSAQSGGAEVMPKKRSKAATLRVARKAWIARAEERAAKLAQVIKTIQAKELRRACAADGRAGEGHQEPRRVSLREVAAELAAQGYMTPSGKPYSASAVASMVGSSP
jgi:hypothetical protein